MEKKIACDEIVSFFSKMLDLKDNNIGTETGEPAWEDILLGVASGGDVIFDKFKETVSEKHWKPLELFSKVFPDIDASENDLSVLCWILPQRMQTRMDNKEMMILPSERWGRVKYYGERFYRSMGNELVKFFEERGIPAVFPMEHPELVKTLPSEKYYLASNWSERHACYAAGLGTFGLCDGLITPYGKAHRCGSIIVNAKLPVTKREYSSFHEYCPFFINGSCGMCIKRCPKDAITKSGHEKSICRQYLCGECAEFIKGFGFDEQACGLCQTGVPCEDRIPGRPVLERGRRFLQDNSILNI